MQRSLIGIAAVAAALLVAGCDKPEEDTGKKTATPKAAKARKVGKAPPSAKPQVDKLAPNESDPPNIVEAKKIFKMQCAQCHGVSGRGDGVAAATLTPKPRNYTDRKWQESVTDKEIGEIIVKGGAAMGKSVLMPPNPQLGKKPEIVEGLVKVVRSFAE